MYTTGIENSTEFGIDTLNIGKVTAMLRDQLYNDKVGAFIREISTNAVDAHISIGKADVPIDVTLPTDWEPSFKVRDYGPGLSVEDMKTIYTSYGKTTKDNNALFNGHLGIGCKSPFAYTRAFTTTSYFNGKRYTYLAYLDDNETAHLSDPVIDDTDQPNGLEVTVPVNKYDYTKVQPYAAGLYYYFDTKPNIVNGNTYYYDRKWEELEDIEYDFVTETFKIRFNVYVDSHLLMNNVKYPIESQHFLDHWCYKLLRNSEILFIAEPNAVKHAVNREGLQYVTQTVNYICDKLEDIYDYLSEYYKKAVADLKNLSLYQKCILYKSVKNFYLITGKDSVSDLMEPYYISDLGLTEVFKKDSYLNTLSIKSLTYMDDNFKLGTIFVDDGKIPRSLIKAAYLDTLNEHRVDILPVLKLAKSQGMTPELEATFKGANLVYITTTQTIEKKRKPVVKDKIFKFDTNTNRWKPTDDTAGVYVEMNRDTIRQPWYLTEPLANFITIYAVKTAAIPKLSAQWMPLETYLKYGLMEDCIESGELDKVRSLWCWNALNKFWQDVLEDIATGIITIDDFENENLKTYLKTGLIHKEQAKETQLSCHFYSYLALTREEDLICKSWEDTFKTLMEKLPMLKFVGYSAYKDIGSKVCIDYINNNLGDFNYETTI